MSHQTEPLVESVDRAVFLDHLRVQEFRKGLLAVKEKFNFLPPFENEIEIIKALTVQGRSTLQFLDHVSSDAYSKEQSNEEAKLAVRNAVNGFQAKFKSAIAGIDQARVVLDHLDGAHGSFAQALPVEIWQDDNELHGALMTLGHFTEIYSLVDNEDPLDELSMPVLFSGLTKDESVDRITELLGGMTAKGVRSMSVALENSEYARMHFWGAKLLEANQHAYGRTKTTEELGVLASKLLHS